MPSKKTRAKKAKKLAKKARQRAKKEAASKRHARGETHESSGAEEDALGHAIASARTKFDSLEAYAARGSSAEMVVDILADEVLADRDLTEGGGAAEARLVRRRIAIIVSAAYRQCNYRNSAVVPTTTFSKKSKQRSAAANIGATNPIQWPTTGHLPRYVAGLIVAWCRSARSAAFALQRIWRWRRQLVRSAATGAEAPLPPLSMSQAAMQWVTLVKLRRTLLTEGPVCSSVKLDGTNLGVLARGDLVGRRRVVLGTTYQKVALNRAALLKTGAVFLRALDADSRPASSEDIVHDGALGSSSPPKCYAAYGELMCNEELYDYGAVAGLHSSWRIFGALRLCADAAAAQAWADGLRARGHVCAVREEAEDAAQLQQRRRLVQVCNSDAFAAVASRCVVGSETRSSSATPRADADESLPAPQLHLAPPTAHASIAACITALRGWMCEERGEGVVVSSAAFGLLKWKISLEPQYGNIESLNKAISALAESALGDAVGADVVGMLHDLLAVAKHPPSTDSAR